MVNYMEELSVTEADNLKKTIAALFRQTCILQMKYDPVTLVPRDNLHYEICTGTHLPFTWRWNRDRKDKCHCYKSNLTC